MKRGIQYGCLLFFLSITLSVFPQMPSQEERDLLVERIEDLFSSHEEDAQLDLSELIDAVENLRQNPVYINSADPEELSRLFFLGEMKIHRILAYIASYGTFVSTNELYGVDGLTPDEADLIIPFISLEQAPVIRKTTVKDVFSRGKQQIIGRYQRVLQEQRGYMDDSIAKTMKYAGNQDKYYLRYRFKYKDQVSFGITSEKDAGEEFFKGSNPYGFDFYSAHFFINNKNHWLNKLAVGDYHLSFGQGLTMWSTYAFGRPSDGINIKRSPNGITPNTSVNESLFFRGTAATFKLKQRHYITGFVSHLKRDGSFSLDDDGNISHFSSFTTDGMHRTANEIAKKHLISQTVIGGRYEWRGHNLKVGATGFTSQLDIPMIPDDRPYNLYAFSGKSLSNAGVDFVWVYRKFEVFGEGAYSSHGGFAAIGGLKAHLASRFQASLSARYYESDYANFFSNAFGVSSTNANEMGIFAGFNTIISSKFTLAGFADTYRFPYMRYQIYAPTSGNDYSLQLNYNPNRAITMYLRYRNSYREYGESSDTIKQTYSRIKNNIRWQGDFSVSRNIVLKTRAEYIHNQGKENKSGFMMYQDIIYRSTANRFTTAFRYAWFNTDSYDERFYAYENDLLYTFSVPAYYYNGNRVYIMFSYKITDNITAWLRIANTSYSNRESIGSGGEEIYGNNKTDVKAQVVIKL